MGGDAGKAEPDKVATPVVTDRRSKQAGKTPGKSPSPPGGNALAALGAKRYSDLRASEQLLDFGECEIAAVSSVKTLYVTNTGSETIDLINVEKTAKDGNVLDTASFFVEVEQACIPPGASALVKVTFIPPAFGNKRCFVRLFSDDPEAETFFVVRGIGINDWWRRAITGYGHTVAQTGHGYEVGDESFYYFLARGNHELGHDEPGLTREQADQIRFNYGWEHVPTDEEIAQRQKEAADFVPPPTLYWDSQGRIGTAEELDAIHLIEDIEAIDNLKTLGGATMYGVSGIWEDDPRKRMQWAALGNTASFALGAVAMPYAVRGPQGGPVPDYRTYESGKSNVLEVGKGGELLPPERPAVELPPARALEGTLQTTRIQPEPQVAQETWIGPERQLGPRRTGIGERLSNDSLRELEQKYGKQVADMTATAKTQADIDDIGDSLGTYRNQYVARVGELASRDERLYAGRLVSLSRGTSTTPGTDLFDVTATGAPEITAVEVKIGVSNSPYRIGESGMPESYRVADRLHEEIMNVIKDRSQPFENRMRMKMALDAGAPIRWELDAFGNVRFKIRGTDAFPQDVVINVPIQVPKR